MSTDDEASEAQADKWYSLGVAVGWEQVSSWLKEKSVKLFADDQDEAAKKLKTLAAEVAQQAKGQRQAHNKRFPHP